MFIGLTGGIGCGKTTVSGIFSKLGWKTLDADLMCRKIYDEPGSALPGLLKDRWGGEVIGADGRINRKRVADIVFNRESERLWLNSVVHPEVFRLAALEVGSSENKWIIFDVPLLFETGWESRFDATVAVWCGRRTQVARLLEKGWTADEIDRRLASQLSSGEKLEKAGFGLINDGSLSALHAQCEILSRKLKEEIWKKKIQDQKAG